MSYFLSGIPIGLRSKKENNMITLKRNHRLPSESEAFIPQSFQDLVDSFFQPSSNTPSEYYFRPSAEIIKHETGFEIRMNLAGVAKSDVHLEIENHVLHVTGERKNPRGDKSALLSEFPYGKFKRNFRLSEDLQEENIAAKMENGILEINIPRKEARKALHIEIG